MQTAVEYLQQHFKTLIQEDKKGLYKLLFEQAKEMHKQNIIDAYEAGEDNIDQDACHIDDYGKVNYYNETYGSKGSDEIKTNKI